MAAPVGFPAGNVQITGYVGPSTLADLYPTHIDVFGKGGFRTCADTNERDFISVDRRDHGMQVFTKSTGEIWELQADLTTWTLISSGSIERGGIAWKDGLIYEIGDIITENEIVYICTRGHTSLVGDNIDGSPTQPLQTSWILSQKAGIEQGGVAWDAGVDYNIGDMVHDEITSKNYWCNTSNTSGAIAGDFASDIAFWSELGNPERGGVAHDPTIVYEVGDLVYDPATDSYYKCIVDGVSTVPSLDPVSWEVEGCVCGYISETGISFTPDYTSLNFFDYTMSGNTTVLAPLGLVAGDRGSLVLRQDSVGTWGVTWDAIYKWPDNLPILKQVPEMVHIFDYRCIDATNVVMEYVANMILSPAVIVLSPPSVIADFAATDAQAGQITFTWTNATGNPTPTYDLYNSTGLVVAGVSSGYVHSIVGTETYYVKAINSEGSEDSNTDSGTGVIVAFTADFETDGASEVWASVGFEWSDDGGTSWNTEAAGVWAVPAAGVYSMKNETTIGSYRFGNTDLTHTRRFINTITTSGPINSGYRMFSELENVITCDASGLDLASAAVTNIEQMFFGMHDATTIDTSGWDTSNVTSLFAVFNNCYSVTSHDVLSWNTSKVTTAFTLFQQNNALTTLDLSSWDTTLIENCNAMFSSCTNLTTLTLGAGFALPNATDLTSMFLQCNGIVNLDLSRITGAKIETLQSMVGFCPNLETVDLSGLVLTNLTNVRAMFSNCTKLRCITNLDTTLVTGVGKIDLFTNCTALVAPNATEQSDLTDGDGAVYVNTNPCP